MKKVISLFFVAILAIITISLCACEPRVATYEGKEILKIETVWSEGFAPFPREFVRTFDFEHGKVTDTRKADEEYLDKDNRKQYNNPKKIATFTEEQGQKFIDEIGALGFFDWEERYATDELVCDGGSSCIYVYFADGTEKSTRIYFMDPPNYDEIRTVFEEAFGVKMYLES